MTEQSVIHYLSLPSTTYVDLWRLRYIQQPFTSLNRSKSQGAERLHASSAPASLVARSDILTGDWTADSEATWLKYLLGKLDITAQPGIWINFASRRIYRLVSHMVKIRPACPGT